MTREYAENQPYGRIRCHRRDDEVYRFFVNSQIFPHIRTHLRRRGRPSFFLPAQSVLGESGPLMRERLRGGPNESRMRRRSRAVAESSSAVTELA